MTKIKYLFVLVALLALGMATTVFAGPAYNASYTTAVTYQNVGSAEANIVFTFYPEDSATGVNVERTLPAGAGASLFLGSVSEVSAGFRGSAVVSSDQPIVATMVQISSDGDVRNRPLSNGFSGGASSILLPSVLKNQFNTTSQFSIQNVHSGAVDLTVTLVDTAGNETVVTHSNLPAGAAKYYDMGTLADVTSGSFNGSATITAVAAGTTTPAPIVGSVMELSTNSGAVSSFEAVTSGANTIYMATGLCNAFNATSFYAVQNTGDASTDVTVSFAGNQTGTSTATIAPGAKASFNACNADGIDAGFSGSATVTADQPIVVLGKVSGGGNSTAFLGEAAGSDALALPYVRFTQSGWDNGTRQRSFIAVQNIGDTEVSGVTIEYLDKNGNVVGTHALDPIPAGAKANSNPTRATGDTANLAEFGTPDANPGGGFGGGAVVSGPDGSTLIAVVRVQSNVGGGSVVGEDYSAIATD